MRQRTWVRFWMPWGLVVLWMVVIFSLSATPDLHAVPFAQRFGILPKILGPVAMWWAELLLRKGAHMAAFGILAALSHWALAGSFAGLPAARRFWWAFAIDLGYAITDEWHQTFVPTRQGTWTDVLIDGAGTVIALLVVGAVVNRYTRKRKTL